MEDGVLSDCSHVASRMIVYALVDGRCGDQTGGLSLTARRLSSFVMVKLILLASLAANQASERTKGPEVETVVGLG